MQLIFRAPTGEIRIVEDSDVDHIARLQQEGWQQVDAPMAMPTPALPPQGVGAAAPGPAPVAPVAPAMVWPSGIPAEWLVPLKERYKTPDKVVAASNDDLLGLPGATHVTVAMIRNAFYEME